MNTQIINNLFEFWEQIGVSNGFLFEETHFRYTMPYYNSWPYKVFSIDSSSIDIEKLHNKMKNGQLPNALGVSENEVTDKLLGSHNFKKTSSIKAMALKLSESQKPTQDFSSIECVDTTEKAAFFADIATKSFGYPVLDSTVIPIIKNPNIKLFLGKHEDTFVSCGIVFLDKHGFSGIHMIGTLSNYRGFGLGKIMTQKLILEAYHNNSSHALLVASVLGEPIYSKIGFKTYGALANYSV